MKTGPALSPGMLRALLSCLSFSSLTSLLMAADAAFSDDGKTVYAIRETRFDVITIPTGAISQIDPDGVEEIDAICRAGGGEFLLLSENALWRWKPLSGPAVLVERLPGESSFSDASRSDDGTQLLLVGRMKDTGKSSLLYRSDSMTGFAPVWLRHLPDAWIRATEFLPDGTLVFSAEGDLWHGQLGWDPIEKNDGSPPLPRVELTAYRFAPVAHRFTYSGTTSEEGVSSIAFGAGRLFVHISRIGGSGWGDIVSMEAPAPMKDDRFETRNGPEDAIKALRSIREVTDNPSRSFLCASADRKLAYMTSAAGDERTHYLADSGYEKGKPVAFRIGQKVVGRK